MAGLFIGFLIEEKQAPLVKVTGNLISDGIHLACGKRVEKSHAILALLDGFQVFQELHLDW